MNCIVLESVFFGVIFFCMLGSMVNRLFYELVIIYIFSKMDINVIS